MTAEPSTVLAASGPAVEPLFRTARAEVAQLALLVRATLREAEVVEEQLRDDASSADHELLRAGLDELVVARRAEFAQALEAERADAARVVDAAHDEVRNQAAALARMAAETAIVDDRPTDLDEVAEVEEPARRLQIVASPQMAPPSRNDVADADDEDPKSVKPPEPPEPVESGTDPAQGNDSTSVGVDRASLDALTSLIQAAVSAGVAQVIGSASPVPTNPTFGHPTYGYPATGYPATAGPGSAHASAPLDRPSFRRRIAHLDVVAPLIAVVLVLVVLVAWLG